MNLEDLIDPEYGLQQDEWSLTAPRFGEEGQLQVIGWSGSRQTHKYYILLCGICSRDSELFGTGHFKITKGNLVTLRQIPCGCSYKAQLSKEQYAVLCSRKANEMGYLFKGFRGDWKGKTSNIGMFCEKHGEWSSGTISTLVNVGQGCPQCGFDSTAKARIKPDSVMIQSFFDSGAFHPDTKFWRSDRKSSQGAKSYWYISCPECGEEGEAVSNNLQQGQRPCACSKRRQQEAYINLVMEGGTTVVAIKFGITINSRRRAKQQNAASMFKITSHSVYYFLDVDSCKQAERECKQELECGVILKRDMSDGYTETTWPYNLEKIIEIYERNGGVKID